MTEKSENKIIEERLSPVFSRKIIHQDKLMVVVCDFTNGPAEAPDPPHSHPHEQITYVAEGELIFYKGGESHHVSKGDVISIPPDVPHSIKTISPRVILVDSFAPIREDFIK